MRVLWLHIRNCPIRWSLPVLIALDLAVLFLRNRFWIGTWPEAGAAAQVPAYLLGVVGAGLAAWSAAAPARHGLGEQFAATRVPRAASEAYRLGATIIILVIPYLLGQAVAFTLTAATFPPGVHLWLGYALLGLFVTLFAVAVGWAIGRRFSPVFATLAATLGFLALMALLNSVEGFIVVSGHPHVSVEPVGLLLRFLAALAMLVALLWLPGVDESRMRPRHTLMLGTGALALVAVVTVMPAVVDREPLGTRATCVNGSVRLCIWPEHNKYLPLIRDLSARVDALPQTFRRPPRLVQFGVERTVRVDQGGVIWKIEGTPGDFYILEGSPWSYGGSIANAITAATFEFENQTTCDWQSITESDQLRLSALGAWLEGYLVNRTTPDYSTNAPAEMQQAFVDGRSIANKLPQREQFEWAEREVTELRGRYCAGRR